MRPALRLSGGRLGPLLITLLLAFLASGCVLLNDPETAQEYRAHQLATLQPGETFGQTFVAQRSRLTRVQLWLRIPGQAETEPQGQLQVELYHRPGESEPQASLVVPYATLAKQYPIELRLGPLDDGPQQPYYLLLKAQGGPLQVMGRSEDVYPYGQAYQNGNPLTADASFRAAYDYDFAALLADLQQGLAHALLLLPLALTLWLPGRLLLRLLRLEKRFAGPERSVLAVGLSLAAIPLTMTWTTTVGLHWSRGGVLAAAGILAVVYVWGERGALRRLAGGWPRLTHARLGIVATPVELGTGADPTAAHSEAPAATSPARWELTPVASGLLLAAVFLFALALRLIMARDLAIPAWVDSVHHAMIARLIAEQGAFPQSYAPFLDIDTAKYHAGFHSVVAVFHWLSGLAVPDALLLLGQVLNALAAAAVYLFTVGITRSRLAGIMAALVTAAFSPMPAYYTSWGRYTQLAGLLILPAAMLLLNQLRTGPASEPPAVRFKDSLRDHLLLLLGAAIACAGLFLTHYRVIAFLGCWLVAYLLVEAWPPLLHRKDGRSLLNDVAVIGSAALLAILLTLPWWPETIRTLFIPHLSWSQYRPEPFGDFSWRFLTTALGYYTLWLAGFGLAWTLVRRRWFGLTLALWVGLLFFLANLGALGLPGNGFVNSLSVEISLFMPLSALGGFLIAELVTAGANRLPARGRPPYFAVLSLLVAGLSLFAAQKLLPILNPSTNLFRQADRPALEWIAENVPVEDTVMINPFAWGYGFYAGSDGGYWVTPLAGRKSMPPPVLYGLGGPSDQASAISEFNKQVIDLRNDPEKLHAALQSWGIRYVYMGVRGGMLSPRVLSTSPLFALRYQGEGTWVFEVLGR